MPTKLLIGFPIDLLWIFAEITYFEHETFYFV